MEEVKDQPGHFYRATHCQVRLSPADAGERAAELRGLSCEVQVCSLLAQVWNEIEHGLVYAGSGGTSPAEQTALQALGRMTEAGDALVSMLLRASAPQLSQPLLSPSVKPQPAKEAEQ